MSKYSEYPHYKLIMTEVSKNLRNFFFTKYPRFWNLKLDFFPLKKVFEIFCQNIVNDPPLNYIWPKFQGICGTFFFAKSPRFSNLKLDYFPHKKVFQDFRNRGKFIPSEVHLTKFSAKLENIFWRQKPPILKVEVGFSSDSKFFSNIFQIGANLSHLNFIWANFQQNQRTFFGRSVGRSGGRAGGRY